MTTELAFMYITVILGAAISWRILIRTITIPFREVIYRYRQLFKVRTLLFDLGVFISLIAISLFWFMPLFYGALLTTLAITDDLDVTRQTINELDIALLLFALGVWICITLLTDNNNLF